MIIDSHIHISYLKKKKNFLQVRDDLLLNMKKGGIDYSIVIPDNLHNSSCADVKTVIELIKNQTKLYMVGTLKITEINKQSLKKIEELFKEKTIRGFKIFPGHDPVYPNDKRWFPVYTLCQKYNFPLIIHTGININDAKCAKYNDPKYIVKIARLYPNLKIIIAHYFWPKLDYCFSITNNIDNIYFDTSGLAHPKVVKTSGGIKKIKEILTKTIKRRNGSVLFGTDWPMSDVAKHIDLINSLNITQKEKQKIFHGNCLKIFQLPNKK